MVNDLRKRTGAGLMDCKKALVESNGNAEEAITLLKKKGMATAAKKAERETSQGIIDSYIHMGGGIGVLIELNCETDFVAKNEDFKKLARDIAMHIAAAAPVCVSREDVPQELVAKEEEFAKAKCEGKPEKAAEQIMKGMVDKYLKEVCLLEQAFVKNPDQTIQDLLTEQVTKMGENITVGQFARFQIGS
tara:strand:- start:82686 stop:83255 length:570 start_codon:yes stop_codon:yes gene_type:complete